MADNIIQVNVTSSKPKRVAVSSSQVSNEITASADTSKYYSGLARNWATSETLVENTDYSSKYYANKSRVNAENTKTYAENTQTLYNDFIDNFSNYQGLLEETAQSGVTTINETSTQATESINNTVENAIETIDTTVSEEVKNLTNIADEKVNVLNTTADEQISNIKATGFYMEDDKLYFINSKNEVEEFKSGGSSRNIGELVTSLLPQTDAGLHLVDGALISGEGAYADFVDYIAELYNANPTANYFTTEEEWQTSIVNYGVCGKFVYDSVANTVRLPKATGIIEGTIDLNALSDLVEAGLPNIEGRFLASISSGNSAYAPTGAFYVQDPNGKKDGYGTSQYQQPFIGIDASRSNPIYGNSDTVQPQTIKGFVYICIATSKKTDVEVNINNVMTDVNGKADTDLTNITNTGKDFASGLGMPSSRYIDLTVGASGTQYTAPANGYYMVDSFCSGYYIIIENNTKDYRTIAIKNGNTDLTASMQVNKDDIISLVYDGNWTPHTWQYRPFRFYYAEGAE